MKARDVELRTLQALSLHNLFMPVVGTGLNRKHPQYAND
jgi:hypothetical protein